MGLHQHTHEMTWRCVAIVGFDALFFCTMVARFVYKTHAWDDMAMRCYIGFEQSTESPILFRSCEDETPFSDQKWASKSGIPCSGFDALFFCTIVARWVYLNTCMRWHGDALLYPAIVGFDALFFCTIVARGVYINTRMRWHGDALLYPAISGLRLCSFVQSLQDGFTSTHAWDDTAMRCYSGVWGFVLL